MAERRASPSSSGSFVSMETDSYVMRSRAPLITRNPPVKTTLMALFLFFGGAIFICVGSTILWAHLINNQKDRGIALFVLGCLMFIPGSYATTVIYGTWRGWEGYDYSIIPSYDD